MQFLVCYDIATDTPAGRRRLRQVAQACKNYGQRVQKSVFEVKVNEFHYAKLEHALLKIIDKKEDSLRIYKLPEPREKHVKVFGWDHWQDFEQPLIL